MKTIIKNNTSNIQHFQCSTFIILLALFATKVSSQSTIDSVLSSIAKNNKTIMVNSQFWDAKKIEFKTGLYLNNPTVEYDYLFGTPANAGNQTDFVINQTFDFPTAYSKKRQLSDEKIAQAEFHLLSTRQDILLEAKKLCIELIYLNKFQLEINTRKQDTEKWLADFQTRLDKGDGNILDVNKAKLQLIEINASIQENTSEINQLNQKLTELNGGNLIVFSDTVYSVLPNLPAFEILETEIETNDPVRKYLEQQKVIGQKQVELTKAMTLPKMEAGYHYQAILGQRFNGVHLGLTLPLWENKNKVRAEQAQLTFYDSNVLNHKNEHYYDIQQQYEKQKNLSITLAEYQNLFLTFNNVELLNKSLRLGQITTIEYFIEMKYYYEALINYLRTEKEYHQAIAELNKYRL